MIYFMIIFTPRLLLSKRSLLSLKESLKNVNKTWKTSLWHMTLVTLWKCKKLLKNLYGFILDLIYPRLQFVSECFTTMAQSSFRMKSHKKFFFLTIKSLVEINFSPLQRVDDAQGRRCARWEKSEVCSFFVGMASCEEETETLHCQPLNHEKCKQDPLQQDYFELINHCSDKWCSAVNFIFAQN